MEEWVNIDYIDIDDFHNYLKYLPEDEQAYELEFYGKQQSLIMLKNEMLKEKNFYYFVKNYSPRDYKIINNRSHVSQRVIKTHVELWNEIHKTRIKKLRIFFI